MNLLRNVGYIPLLPTLLPTATESYSVSAESELYCEMQDKSTMSS